MRYLIIEKDYTVSQSDVLSGHLRMRARTGDISLIDCKTGMGMNRATYPYSVQGDWSYVNKYERPDSSSPVSEATK